MQIPVIPSFTQGETSVQHLQQLSTATQFATVASYSPVWRLYKAATQAIAAGSWVTIQFGTVAIDTDGVFNENNGVTINTQGYYSTEACLPFQGEATAANNLQISFLWTAGPSNANYASGATVRYGGAATSAAANATNDISICQYDTCPVVCYPGDIIIVQAFLLTATTLNIMTNSAASSGWFPPQFSGKWVRMGS